MLNNITQELVFEILSYADTDISLVNKEYSYIMNSYNKYKVEDIENKYSDLISVVQNCTYNEIKCVIRTINYNKYSDYMKYQNNYNILFDVLVEKGLVGFILFFISKGIRHKHPYPILSKHKRINNFTLYYAMNYGIKSIDLKVFTSNDNIEFIDLLYQNIGKFTYEQISHMIDGCIYPYQEYIFTKLISKPYINKRNVLDNYLLTPKAFILLRNML